MGRIETATLRMLLQDNMSAGMQKVASTVKGVTAAEAGLVAESARLGLASKKLEQFDKVRATFAASRTAFNEARANVERLGKAMNAADAPSVKMRQELERARKEVSRSAESFAKQKDRLLETKRAYEQLAGGPLKNATTAQANLRRQTEETTAAIKRQVAATVEGAEREAAALKAQNRAASDARKTQTGGSGGRHGDTSTLGGIVSLGIAHEFQEGMRKALEQYREFDKERRYGGAVMGLTYEQQKPLIEQAIHGGGTSKFNDIQWLESQRELAARGYSKEQVLGFTPTAARLATALDKTMPEAVKLLEGSLLGFGKDTSTYAKAMAAAERTADLQVKASKISGMQAEDIEALYKRGAAPARMAGLSEESLLAFGAISKKANLGGDEASTAFRALVKDLMSPTAEARTAMSAAGVDFSKYQAAPKAMNLNGFVQEVARKYGVQLDHNTIGQLGSLFSDRQAMADPSAFTPAVTQLLRGSLGGNDAKSLKSIAGLAGRYRDDSVGKVDVDRLMNDVILKMAENPALANSIFGGKNGGKIFAALGDPTFFKKILGELLNESQGYAAKVSNARMAGFDGAMSMLQGSMLNLEGALGRAFDNDGKGGFLTTATRGAAEFTQALAEADPAILRMGAAAAAGVAAFAGLKGLGWVKGGFGLQRSATHLDEAALALKEAAAVQRGGHLPGGAVPGEGIKPGDIAKDAPKGGILGSGGVGGLGGALSKGIVGAIAYEVGTDAIRLFEDHVLGYTDKDHDKWDAVMGSLGIGTTLKHLDDTLNRFLPSIDGKAVASPIEQAEQGRRSADEFRRDPEAARGRAMMQRFGLLPSTPKPEALLPVPDATPDEPDEDGGEGEGGLLHKSAYVTGSRRRTVGGRSDEQSRMVQLLGQGTYEGLRRYFDQYMGGASGGGSGGGGIINASYGGAGFSGSSDGGSGHLAHLGLPNLRRGRAPSGGYRDTPDRTVPTGTTPLGRTGSKFSGKAPAIMRGLMDRYGLSQEQAAGIVGNLGHESAEFTAYHEGRKAPSEGGVGWAQWTGPRRRAFEAWTKAHGLNPTSDEASWRYLTEGDPQTTRAIAAVKRTSNRHDAVKAFHDSFEISADTDPRTGAIRNPKNWNHRLGLADKAFALGPGTAQAPTYADEGHRGFARAQGSLLPRPERQSPVAPSGPRIEAMNAGVDFDHSGLDTAIAKVDTLHAKLRGLKATASIDINHNHKGDAGARPGSLRTALNGGYASDGRSWT